MKFISIIQTMDFTSDYMSNKYVSFIVDKRHIPEYNSNNAFQNEESCMNEEKLSTISKEDEAIAIKYILEVMKTHDLITEDEYRVVLYKYS